MLSEDKRFRSVPRERDTVSARIGELPLAADSQIKLIRRGLINREETLATRNGERASERASERVLVGWGE